MKHLGTCLQLAYVIMVLCLYFLVTFRITELVNNSSCEWADKVLTCTVKGKP